MTSGLPPVHFISGLPRSGSTLLAGILRQNPSFHAAMTGPLGTLFGSLLNAMSPQNETALFLSLRQKRDLLRGLFEAYYRDQAGRSVIFDTNRVWTARMPALLDLFPDAKLLCCVRNVSWVLDSLERLVRRNAFEPSSLFASAAERATVYSRVEALAHRERLVGFAWSALKEAYYGERSDRLLLIEYDTLCRRPDETLALVYDFLGQPRFAHDFDNVDYAEPEFDRHLGTPGLHTVRRKVRFAARPTILPPDLFDKYAGLTFWRDPAGSSAFRIVAEAGQPP
ncbi:sulfotransferase family protein [Marinivivus vitaminiproducens]|uniref:sulfotransferase family protein n=1 Tax=Marinivivus vitaminiproducens TaxID=3035935 RepID=UPI0027A75805|nr:sulfotransferase [Geminicoccaceae bacterium SCSIO 64248]